MVIKRLLLPEYDTGKPWRRGFMQVLSSRIILEEEAVEVIVEDVTLEDVVKEVA